MAARQRQIERGAGDGIYANNTLYPVPHRQLVFSIPIMLKAQGRTSDVLIEKLMAWYQSGFRVDMTLPLIGVGNSAA